MVTAEEAVWNALLEMKPQLAQMEEPDVREGLQRFLAGLESVGAERLCRQHDYGRVDAAASRI
jgi:hypothetical protein